MVTPEGRRFIAEWVIVIYYIAPLAICWCLAAFTEGLLWWLLVFAGLAWPIGNLIAGLIFGQD